MTIQLPENTHDSSSELSSLTVEPTKLVRTRGWEKSINLKLPPLTASQASKPVFLYSIAQMTGSAITDQ